MQRVGLWLGAFSIAGLVAVLQSPILKKIGDAGRAISRNRTPFVVAASIGLIAACVLVLLPLVAPPSKEASGLLPPSPVTATATLAGGSCTSFIMPQPIEELGPSPADSLELPAWALERGGAVAENFGDERGTQQLFITIGGYDERPVTLTRMEINVIERGEALSGAGVGNDCGTPIEARFARIDLDQSPPQITESSVDVVPIGADLGVSVTPLTFPYIVSSVDTETILLIASTTQLVSWEVLFTWSNGRESGVLVVKQGVQPFLVSGRANRNGSYNPGADGQWLGG